MHWGFIFYFHKPVKTEQLFVCIRVGGGLLKQSIHLENRRDLEAKMSKVFKENVKMLSKDMQRILVDDLVTAFQNRKHVLIRARE